MNKEDEIKLNKYYSEIRHLSKCTPNVKHAFMNTFKARINDYLYNSKNATFEDVVETFGTAEEIVLTLNEEIEFYKRKARKYLYCEIVTLIVVALLVTTIIILVNTLGGSIVVS